MNTTFFESVHELIPTLTEGKPSVGKTVKVAKGRKHVGKVGIVRWHGEDKYDTSRRYMSHEQIFVSECIGRLGYRVQIETESGEKFFVSADYVEIVSHE